MITEKSILEYIRENAPVPYSYIHRHFEVEPRRLSMQMWRLRKQGLIRRVLPRGEGPLWIITESGARRLEFYGQQEGARAGARAETR